MENLEADLKDNLRRFKTMKKLSERANSRNKVTVGGLLNAQRQVFAFLGNELGAAYNKNHENVCYDRRGEYTGNATKADIKAAYAQEALERTRPALETFDAGSAYDVLAQCLDVILRVYCDHDLDDEQLSKELLAIKQFQERKKMEKAA